MLCVMKYIVMLFQYFVFQLSDVSMSQMIAHTSCYKGWVNVTCVIKFNRMMKYRIRKEKTTMIAKHSPQERKNITFCFFTLLGL